MWTISQPLPYKDITFDWTSTIEKKHETDENEDTNYFVGVDLKYANEIEKRNKIIPFFSGKQKNNHAVFTEDMISIMLQKIFAKLISDWSNNEN